MLELIKKNSCDLWSLFKGPKVGSDAIPKIFQVRYTILPVALVVLFLYTFVDTPVEKFLLESGDYPHVFVDIFDKVTEAGNSVYIIVACALWTLARLCTDTDKLTESVINVYNKITMYCVYMLGTVIIGGLVGQVFKMVIGRGRPKFFEEFGSHYFQHFHAPGYDFTSMPSGHSITIASIGIALMILLPRFKYLWLFMAVIVAFSRVAVSAHYPSDVVFGFYVGTYSSLFIYYWMKNRNII